MMYKYTDQTYNMYTHISYTSSEFGGYMNNKHNNTLIIYHSAFFELKVLETMKTMRENYRPGKMNYWSLAKWYKEGINNDKQRDLYSW
jgi:hypothetical protein